MSEVPLVQITTTVNSLEEADMIANDAVELKLAACGQITGPIVSHYVWNDEKFREEEWQVSLKTLKTLEYDLMKLIEELHSYETPELVSVRLETVSDEYLEWMLHSLGSNTENGKPV
jgi:periplasmic divalent cation tolerance protein